MKIIWGVILAITATYPLAAQSPSKILSQAEKALGGNGALKKVVTMTRSGPIKRISDGAQGHYELVLRRPNLFSERYDIDGVERQTAYNGRSGWTRNSRDGLQTLTGRSSTYMQAAAVYRNNLWLGYKDRKSKISSGGQSAVNGNVANIVVLTDLRGVSIRMFFDTATALLVRDEIPVEGGVIASDYLEYREVGGLKYPSLIRRETDGEIHEIHLEDVRVNPAVAASSFSFPAFAKEPLADIPRLLNDIQSNEDKVEAILDTYSYVQKSIKRELGSDGILREKGSETVQLSFYKGRRITRLLEKDGRPLSPSQQEQADKEAAKQAEEIEREITKKETEALKQNRSGTPSDDSPRISIAEVLRASKLMNPRRERFRGRDVIVFDFEPDPTYDLSKAKSALKFFGKTAGVMWVDEQDKQVARVEAVLFDSYKIGGGVIAKLQKGASFTLEKERINDEIWLPSLAEINLSVRVLLVKGISVNQLVKFYDYRKFATEVKDAATVPQKTP